MHLTDGDLRAFLDQELNPADQERVNTLLADAAATHQRAETLQGRAAWVGERLAALDPLPTETPTTMMAARERLQQRLAEPQKETRMSNVRFARQTRLPWAGLAAVLVLALALAFPPVRAAATQFLGLFRAQQISVVPVDAENVEQLLDSTSALEQMLTSSVQVEALGETREVANAAVAREASGMNVRLPAAIAETPQLRVQPGAEMRFNVDLPRVRAVLDELGLSEVELPESLDGETITVEVSPSVIAAYGGCGFDQVSDFDEVIGDCTILTQMPSPSISAPPDLDIAALGQAYLQVLGMTRDEARAFSETTDWTTTLAVPIPRYDTDHQQVAVDGVTGTLIERNFEEGHAPAYLLVWVKDGIIYGLKGVGDGSSPETLEIANSLQ